jgi:hypothetical protein
MTGFATGCGAPADGDLAAQQAAGGEQVESNTSALGTGLSLNGEIGGTCGNLKPTLTSFPPSNGSTTQLYEVSINSELEVGQLGCLLRVGLNVGLGFNLRVTLLDVNGNMFFDPATTGDFGTTISFDTTAGATRFATPQANSGFFISSASAINGSNPITGPTQCQHSFAPDNLNIKPFMNINPGSKGTGSAAISSIRVFIQATPC